MEDQKLLAAIQSDNADVRFAAWRQAGESSAAVVPELGRLMGASAAPVSKAAREALTTMAHAVGKDADAPGRAALVTALLGLTTKNNALPVRVHAFRLLSGIAGGDKAAQIAAALRLPEVQEEAIYCLERIPGADADRELLAAYKDVKDDFKPRVLYALGHRRIQAAAAVCVDAMRSTNKEIAMAAVRAYGRIGKAAAAAPVYPDAASLNEWQRVEEMDSQLRFADQQARDGNHAEAIRIYSIAMDRTEEHWQCAGIIGLAKIGTPEAATIIHPKMKSQNRVVRITAEKAWISMAPPERI
jgi:HEAT repeat protein